MTQNKSDSIDLILQCGRVVDKNCCVVLPASGFPYLIQSPRQYKRKVATTYLAIKKIYIYIYILCIYIYIYIYILHIFILYIYIYTDILPDKMN